MSGGLNLLFGIQAIDTTNYKSIRATHLELGRGFWSNKAQGSVRLCVLHDGESDNEFAPSFRGYFEPGNNFLAGSFLECGVRFNNHDVCLGRPFSQIGYKYVNNIQPGARMVCEVSLGVRDNGYRGILPHYGLTLGMEFGVCFAD